ncbi:MAG: tol-pal system-associated acyl-CoA thioesterase [Alphaproteobacteria bacterium]
MNNFRYRIYFEDTDAGGIVYYANYLKFYERARTDYLRMHDIYQNELALTQNIGFVVRKIEAEYLSPARLDDEITVSVKFLEVSNLKVKIFQEIKIDNKIISSANIDLVCINTKSLRPTKIPEHIKNIFYV